jgi:hypothetical protein
MNNNKDGEYFWLFNIISKYGYFLEKFVVKSNSYDIVLFKTALLRYLLTFL